MDAFDGVFMDREMPLMNGVDATRIIMAMQKEPGRLKSLPVPVIGLSASVESMDVWTEAGMSYLLSKPFSRKELNYAIRLVDTWRTLPPSMPNDLRLSVAEITTEYIQ
jgi:CheY-like chemotaxis protein